ncbi:hypothetical protein HDU98_001448, partial [Podochytrium sp. JEL0797]
MAQENTQPTPMIAATVFLAAVALASNTPNQYAAPVAGSCSTTGVVINYAPAGNTPAPTYAAGATAPAGSQYQAPAGQYVAPA